MALSRFCLGMLLSSALVLPLPTGAQGTTAGSTDPVVSIDRTTVAARGRQSAIVQASAFGRYAVFASSSQGVGVQLVDRMAGGGPISGEAGRKDGRLDVFLDRGEYKIVTHAAERGSGEARLTAQAFREINRPAPLLVEQRLERGSLGDFEQRSYWLEITNRRTVAIEAAGRHLADLRLWRDGLWLVDAEPQIQQGQARAQQPLAIARYSVTLDPGLYLLTAYGGPSQAWTEASDAKPFFLRVGIPTLPAELRRHFTVGELGVERFVVPESANYFRLELPAAEPASLEVERFDADRPFGSGGNSARIDKRSLPPVAEVRFGGERERLVTVRAEPGKSFVLQHFNEAPHRTFEGSGAYWIASTHAGHAEDSVGASAVLARRSRDGKVDLVAERTIDLGEPWHRRFNLLDELTLFIKVPGVTVLRVSGDGVKARYRLEPFMTSRPRDYQAPPARDSGYPFPVLAGLYVLTVIPETRGILDLHLLPGLSTRQDALTPVASGVRFADTALDAAATYTLYLNRQPGSPAGAVIRRLPIDLRAALPVVQAAGESLTVPIAVEERGTLRARGEDGKPVALTLDNGRSGPAIDLEPGRYRVTIASAPIARSYSLALEPRRLDSSTPLPPMPDARIAGLPKFPVIAPESPSFIDLDRAQMMNYSVRVDRPGLYQFESTGLLDTEGRVRTRINPSLFADSSGGTGRNFMIQRYLREGDYQLAVKTNGETRGHLGVRLATTAVDDGGELREGEVARAQLAAGRAIAYRFQVSRRGTYALQAMGLGRRFDVRLEDEQGWPIGAPVQPGDLSVELDPGGYRLVVMPQTHEARVLTRLDRQVPPQTYRGRGPHRIAIGAGVENTWSMTPRKKGPALRAPDQWDFSLPAAAEVTLSVGKDMEATLVDLAAPKTPLASFDARQAWRGTLSAGRFRVQAKATGKNNHVRYSLQTASTQLLAGQSRTVAVPSSLPISIGSDGLTEIESFGPSDVRGRLYDAAGELVAQSDDRTGDWNFQIAQPLHPGAYRLAIDPIGSARASTTVSVKVPGEAVEPPLAAGQEIEVRDARVHVYPLTLPSDANVVLATARSGDAVGLALEGQGADGWVALGSRVDRNPYLAAAVDGRFSAYRLRAWSADRRSLRLTLKTVAARLSASTESKWIQGAAAAQPIDTARPGIRLALVSLPRPGSFRLAGDFSRWRLSDSSRRVALEQRDAVVTVNGATLLLVGELERESAPAAERLRLPGADAEALRVEIPAGEAGVIDQHPDAGMSLVIARSRAGQPGAAPVGQSDGAGLGFVAGESVVVVLPGMAAPVRFWNASGVSQPIELDVRQVALRQGDSRPLGFGVSEGSLAARGVTSLSLPKGELSARLTLSPGSAAVFLRQGRPVATHWAGGEAVQDLVRVADAEQLALINVNADPVPYGIELAQHSGSADPPLRPGELFERNLATNGRLRVAFEVPQGAAYRLRVAGPVQALAQERSGRVQAGDDLSVADSGVLWLSHRPGTVVAWLEETRADEPGRSERWVRTYGETRVAPPQTVRLGGRHKLLSVAPEQPAMLHVRSDTPLVSQWLVRGQPARTDAYLNGAQANFPMTAGGGLLLLRAIGADALAGSVTVGATPVTPLSEGPGPEVLLGPGGARLFSFDLVQAGTVGIGVRASADVIRAALLDAKGATLAEGVVQMPTLQPGRYFLAVEMPPDSAPVTVRPIVIGLARPDTRPPYDILRRYVENVEGEGPALIYVPPPPPPPPSAVATDDAAAGEADGEAREGPGEVEAEEGAGEMPAEEEQ